MRVSLTCPVLICSLCWMTACGPLDEVGECGDTWWVLEQDGVIVAEGEAAKIVDFGAGDTGFSGDFQEGTQRSSCGLTSTRDIATGLHTSLGCIITTDQGTNPSWVATKDDTMDLRPNITALERSGLYISGMLEGQILRQDVLSYSPPDIQLTTVNYRFYFKATDGDLGECSSITPTYPGDCNTTRLRKACSANGCSTSDSADGFTCSNSGKTESVMVPTVVTSGDTCREIIQFIVESC